MFRFKIYYQFIDPWSSENDYEGIERVSAFCEEAAVAKFRVENPPDRYLVQCVGRDDE